MVKVMLREEVKQTVIQGFDLLASLLVGVLTFTLTYTILLLFGLPEMETTLVAFVLLVATLIISRLLTHSWSVPYVPYSLEHEDSFEEYR